MAFQIRRLGTPAATLAALTLFALPAGSQSAPRAELTGTWRGEIVTDGPRGSMTLTVAYESSTWKVTNEVLGEGIPEGSPPREIKVEDAVLSFWQTYAEFESFFRATLEQDGWLRGTVEAYQAGTLVASGSFALKKE